MKYSWVDMKTHPISLPPSPPPFISPLHASSSEWGVMRRFPLSSSPTDPQCEQCGTMYGHNATIVESHCRLPLCRDRHEANGQWQPYRSTQISSSAAYPALFKLLRTWIEKIETDEMRNEGGGVIWPNRSNFTVKSLSPLTVMWWWCLVEDARARSNISIVRGQAWPSLSLMGGCTRCTNSSPYITPTFIPMTTLLTFIPMTPPTIPLHS